MDETVLKIAIAGFMHDIGKFAGEDILHVSNEFLNNNADLYQPHYEGRYTHKHAVYTAAFIDRIEKLLPKVFNRAHWGLEDTFINLAAGHHKPETPMQWVIAVADRISSGWDREEFDQEYNRAVPWRDYKKTRLLPIFERLMHEQEAAPETSADYSYSYPLKELSTRNIFPDLGTCICPADDEAANTEYKNLFDEFVDGLERLLHKDENLELWFEHFESLVMVFASSIPSARAGNVIPDVSLYDHSKVTAALAVAIYLYHKQTDSLVVEAIKDYGDRKFLIISGDFYGIQDFIFCESGDVRKLRAKILRGRSFAISLFSELAADMLCREIGIPSICTVLNAAGKFTVIAPNAPEAKDAIHTVEEKVNDWLMDISYGENSVGIASVEATANDFVNGRFIEIWDKLALVMEKKKLQKIDLERHGGVAKDYLDGFDNTLERRLCPFCGKRPSSPEAENSRYLAESISACKICRDHIFLGENLVKEDRLAIATTEANLRDPDKRLLEPIFGLYQVAFVEGAMRELARSGQLLKYWDISISADGAVAKEVTARFINGYVPKYSAEDHNDERLLEGAKSEEKKLELIDQMKLGDPKTFEHVANKSLNPRENGNGFRGIEALGVLKADVDELGMLMSCGLRKERFTLSRIATLSRQMNYYFAVYLPHLLKSDPRFKNVYTVFVGGDDLFLIGPWNRMIELATLLQKTFGDYVCHNEKIHFSAGITLHKAHTPLDDLAEGAESALERSKDEGRNRITLFRETAKWSEFLALVEVKGEIERWKDSKLVNNAMIYRFNDFIEMAGLANLVLKEGEIAIEDMECLKWPAMFCYSVERNIGKEFKDEARNEAIREVSKAKLWLGRYGAKLKMALWDIIYNHR
ncbi:MAG: type III-A CRISPR-associated protein Cas10/Csm1 [Desulfobacterales bacterium S3730MH5]|nr:MAG: type III-A CRISPR-associated protein Cas10/Csm1 [Desulfobacterales bacterium S3730MH5]